MRDTELKTIANALADIDRALLAARLRFARQRVYPTAVAASDELEARGTAKSARAYQSYESGDRKVKLHDLSAIALLLDMPVSFFLFGGHPEIDDREVDALAMVIRAKLARKKKAGTRAKQQITNNPMPPVTLPAVINHVPRQVETNTIHNPGVRLIPILSASEIRNLNTGRGGLAAMSGQSLPVPQSLGAGEHSYSYQIPEHDLAMASKGPDSFGPGTFVVADRVAPILPGKLVLADIEGHDEPLFRIYRASRAYAPGVSFTLDALNPAYEPIPVTNPASVLGLARVLYTVRAH